jgi:hypothetical protein
MEFSESERQPPYLVFYFVLFRAIDASRERALRALRYAFWRTATGGDVYWVDAMDKLLSKVGIVGWYSSLQDRSV